MKRSWLIGAALLFSLSAVACSDDEEDGPGTQQDGGGRDAGPGGSVDAGGGLDSGLDAGNNNNSGDAGDAG